MFFTYAIGPIDFQWQHLKTVEKTAAGLPVSVDKWGDGGPSRSEFLAAWEQAQQEAKLAHWEGDFRHQPVVFWIPNANDATFDFGFVIKQDNNGSTFVISPVELPHLRTMDWR